MSMRVAAIAALTFDLGSGGREVQLLPAGEFRARDGRPKEVPAWRIDAQSAARLIARVHARKTPLVIDYEHQTLNAAENGQPAPAAAWFSRLEWREGSGLWAIDVEWTKRAAALIAEKEYRFLSPVLAYDKKTGVVVDLCHAAITNNPAVDGMADLAGRAAARFLPQQQETDMDALNALLAALGLKPVETEELAIAAAKAYAAIIKEKDDKLAALTTEVGSKGTEIATLKAASTDAANPDPAKFVSIDTMKALQTQVAELSAAQQDREVDEIVVAALADGRLLPAQEKWARGLGKSNAQALKDFVASAQPIAALKGRQSTSKPNDAAHNELGEEDLAVCKNMGLDPEDYKKTSIAAA